MNYCRVTMRMIRQSLAFFLSVLILSEALPSAGMDPTAHRDFRNHQTLSVEAHQALALPSLMVNGSTRQRVAQRIAKFTPELLSAGSFLFIAINSDWLLPKLDLLLSKTGAGTSRFVFLIAGLAGLTGWGLLWWARSKILTTGNRTIISDSRLQFSMIETFMDAPFWVFLGMILLMPDQQPLVIHLQGMAFMSIGFQLLYFWNIRLFWFRHLPRWGQRSVYGIFRTWATSNQLLTAATLALTIRAMRTSESTVSGWVENGIDPSLMLGLLPYFFILLLSFQWVNLYCYRMLAKDGLLGALFHMNSYYAPKGGVMGQALKKMGRLIFPQRKPPSFADLGQYLLIGLVFFLSINTVAQSSQGVAEHLSPRSFHGSRLQGPPPIYDPLVQEALQHLQRIEPAQVNFIERYQLPIEILSALAWQEAGYPATWLAVWPDSADRIQINAAHVPSARIIAGRISHEIVHTQHADPTHPFFTHSLIRHFFLGEENEAHLQGLWTLVRLGEPIGWRNWVFDVLLTLLGPLGWTAALIISLRYFFSRWQLQHLKSRSTNTPQNTSHLIEHAA